MICLLPRAGEASALRAVSCIAMVTGGALYRPQPVERAMKIQPVILRGLTRDAVPWPGLVVRDVKSRLSCLDDGFIGLSDRRRACVFEISTIDSPALTGRTRP